ncbi:hypothetical protein B0H67DRAFT_237244 [Lasiosphaeris hirsuta]|uniref:Uncharacterized protein n=1 Tax=Lasiosphaeris hirsuta TaxID=260670 RepID=A0AA40AG76_9PEZI|nr:hypothetical protein B0H67DRAFT_237244 [Lasiosphaeris hirsuta]
MGKWWSGPQSVPFYFLLCVPTAPPKKIKIDWDLVNCCDYNPAIAPGYCPSNGTRAALINLRGELYFINRLFETSCLVPWPSLTSRGHHFLSLGPQ